MGRCRHAPAAWLVLVLAAGLVHTGCGTGSGAPGLPTNLTDAGFWALTSELSESAGAFTHSDNLVSNEAYFVHLLRMLRPAGGVYIGVGPEQNYSYIAKLRPDMAFIVDIREENRDLHLLYKALFASSVDRADFVSRLFSRPRPAGVGPGTAVEDLFTQYAAAKPDTRLYEANLALIQRQLLETHRFPLSTRDLASIEYAFKAFYRDGPDIQYGRTRPGDSPGPSYRALMTATDVSGQPQSYLATEDAFAFVKDLHARNLIVPVVGDFSGPTAIRRVGEYLRQHGRIVDVFYASNVEVYLNRAKRQAFCDNLATLPHDSGTWFIVSKSMQPLRSKLTSCRSGAP